MKKRLLVEFSCEHPTRYPIKRFTACAVIYLCDKWLPQHYFKPVLGYFSKVGHCKVDFCNVCVELHQISVEIEVTLKQEIFEFVRLSATKDVRDVGFSSP